jgi:hypothetical protein
MHTQHKCLLTFVFLSDYTDESSGDDTTEADVKTMPKNKKGPSTVTKKGTYSKNKNRYR